MRTAADYDSMWSIATRQGIPPGRWTNLLDGRESLAHVCRMVASDAMGAGLLVSKRRALRPAYAPGIAEYTSRITALGAILYARDLPTPAARRPAAQARITQVAAVIDQWRTLDANREAEAALDAVGGPGTGSDIWWSRLLDHHARPCWVPADTHDDDLPHAALVMSAATALCWLRALYTDHRVTEDPRTLGFITYPELSAWKRDMHHQTAN